MPLLSGAQEQNNATPSREQPQKKVVPRTITYEGLEVEIKKLAAVATEDKSGNPNTCVDESGGASKVTIRWYRRAAKSNNLSKILINDVCPIENVKVLELRGYPFETIPDEICALASLTELAIYNSQIVALPVGIDQLKNLQTLFICDCKKLASLPPEIGNLRNIINLKINSCRLVQLPDEICRLTSLEHLKVQTTALPNDIGDLQALQTLHVGGGNGLVRLPESIGRLAGLKSLMLSMMRLESLPRGIGSLVGLTNLSIHFCSALVDLPAEIGNLENLQDLEVSLCKNFFDLPPAVGHLKKLRRLRISNCPQLRTLPAEIGLCAGLECLCLTSCGLERLPADIGRLSSLSTLVLGTLRQLEKFPTELKQLTNLKTLKVECCPTDVVLGFFQVPWGDAAAVEEISLAHSKLGLEYYRILGGLPQSLLILNLVANRIEHFGGLLSVPLPPRLHTLSCGTNPVWKTRCKQDIDSLERLLESNPYIKSIGKTPEEKFISPYVKGLLWRNRNHENLFSRSASIPLSLWPLVLANSAGGQPTILYELLREGPLLLHGG